MKTKAKVCLSCLLAILCFIVMSAEFAVAASNTEVASFSVGFGTGVEMQNSSNAVDSKAFLHGLKDAFGGEQPPYSQDDFMKAQAKVQEVVKKAMAEEKVKSPDSIKDLKLPAKEKEIISYISGYSFADQLDMMGGLFDHDAILKGLDAAMKGEKNPYSQEDQEKAMAALRKDFEKKMKTQIAAVAKPQIEAGKKFLEDYSKKEGVKKIPEGIYYEELKVGTGASPDADDKVKVHYTGSLIDGTVFDSSVERDEPFVAGISEGIIDGWKMVLPHMKVGDKWKVVIPQEYAYGLQGIPQAGILPGATLVFEIELLDIEK